MRRPGPLRWAWYAVGGRLPPQFRDWVLFDLTCRTWPLRHLLRLVAQIVPIAALLLLVLPGPLTVRVAAVVCGGLIGLAYSAVFLYEATETRALKAGFPRGTLQRVREERRATRDLARAAARHDRTFRHLPWSRP
ncbi:DUF5313 family protein [Pseudonocardia sp.]|uniref:DUF5313 family protein n=1 Tax=Pseudonocardia sp. TaxID=60912 RepID=UPI003D136E9C